MLRKLFAVALITGVSLIASAPAPAIDFICSCTVCHAGSNLACRDLKHTVGGGFVACSTYWTKNCQ